MKHVAVICLGVALGGCSSKAPEGHTAKREGSAPAPDALREITLDVAIDENGVVRIGNARLLFDDQILAAFEAFHERAPRGRLVLRSHRAALHGRLVRIVDLAKEARAPFEIVVEDGT